jgi:hypothetical protein
MFKGIKKIGVNKLKGLILILRFYFTLKSGVFTNPWLRLTRPEDCRNTDATPMLLSSPTSLRRATRKEY